MSFRSRLWKSVLSNRWEELGWSDPSLAKLEFFICVTSGVAFSTTTAFLLERKFKPPFVANWMASTAVGTMCGLLTGFISSFPVVVLGVPLTFVPVVIGKRFVKDPRL